MDIIVGAYHLNGDLTKEQARKLFLENFPSVTVSDLDKELDRLYGVDKPKYTPKEVSESEKIDTKTGDESAKGKRPSGDKQK